MTEEEEYEVLDLSAIRDSRNYLENIMGDVTKRGAVQQIAIGGATGWFSGYICLKVGKLAALSIGTTILVVRIAQHQGYLQINWSKVNSQMAKARRKVEQEANRQYPQLNRKVRQFFQQNMFLASSFGVGFLFGVAF